jgi:Mg2+ and Co2+ transporter CorA
VAQIVCAEWLTVSRYVAARLRQIEWELERPEYRLMVLPNGSSLERLHTWRRRLPLYRTMVRDAKTQVFRHCDNMKTHAGGLSDMGPDFDIVNQAIEDLLQLTERIAAVAAAVSAIEESRGAAEQNRSLGRLTYLAVIFAPLSFLSSFFSMADDITELSQTIWVYFCAAVPLSILVYLIVNKEWITSLRSFSTNRRDRWRDRRGQARQKT